MPIYLTIHHSITALFAHPPTLTVPSEEPVTSLAPSWVKATQLTKEAWPRNSFSTLPARTPWMRAVCVCGGGWVVRVCMWLGCVCIWTNYWMWLTPSKEAVASWRESREKAIEVMPACIALN